MSTTTTSPASVTSPLKSLLDYGQSVWLDYIRRDLITGGELKRMIDEDGLRGMTSNPAIFEKAITGSNDYRGALAALAGQVDSPKALYERLAVQDIQDAADALRPVYDATHGRDGYVSLEVAPTLAHDTAATLDEARRLWATVERPNVMIKVPGTPEGLPVIEQLLSEGINVNITLLFAQSVYEQVAEAYLAALERRAAGGGDISRIGSVASFFVSRIDTLVDGLVEKKLAVTTDAGERARLEGLRGKVAIANAKLTYQRYLEIFSGPRWEALAQKGAQTQRVLWASTSTKNPAYRDVMYVEELIGPDTVDTIPPATFDAFKDHGQPRPSLVEDVEGARATMDALAAAGISMKEVTDQLLVDAVRLFVEPFEKLLAAVAKAGQASAATRVNRQTATLPQALAAAVTKSIGEWKQGGKAAKLWSKDPSVWTGADEGQWLGWLDIVARQRKRVAEFEAFANDVKQQAFTHAVVLGMGGSSLCPEVMARTFRPRSGFPALLVLDSTDPAQVRAIEAQIDLAATLFIVSSKSGSTLEPNIFAAYFFDRVRAAVGPSEVGKRFVAVTDPGSHLQTVAEQDHYRHIFFGDPTIGGRYSALSDFGLVPAAAMGIDVAAFLERTEEMVHACSSSVPVDLNPGIVLGTILGTAGLNGRDKVTIVTSPGIADLGAWLEQLLAESTGKIGKGLIPVDREPLGAPDVYGEDRLFVYLRLESAPDAAQDAAVAALEKASHPVVRIAVDSVDDIGEEFFRWEIATAVAGSLLGINAFNQPDVEASKNATRKLTSQYEETGSLPAEAPMFEGNGIRLFTDAANAAALDTAVRGAESLVAYLRAHLARLAPGDYFAILAYVERNAANDATLQSLRQAVRDRTRNATCVGFGPRFLHSTGQAYKGGPNTGVFLQITSDDVVDVPVPGQKYTFGLVKAAQARGDLEVLVERGRRALRAHVGPNPAAGLAALSAALREAIGTLVHSDQPGR